MEPHGTLFRVTLQPTIGEMGSTVNPHISAQGRARLRECDKEARGLMLIAAIICTCLAVFLSLTLGGVIALAWLVLGAVLEFCWHTYWSAKSRRPST